MILFYTMDEESDETPIKTSCFYSSIVFIINSILALYYNYLLYSFLFFILVVTSLLFHSNTNSYTIVIDKIAILSVVLYGGWLFLEKCKNLENIQQTILAIITVFTFLATIYIYYYGYLYNQYCYHEDKCIGNLYHSLLHFISCIGHSIIIIL